MRSALPGDVLYANSALSADVTGNWISLNGRSMPHEGLPVGIFMKSGSTSSTAGSAKITIHDSSDGSNAGAVIYEETFVIPVAANSLFVDKIVRISTRKTHVRVTIDLTGTIDGDVDVHIGFRPGDVP